MGFKILSRVIQRNVVQKRNMGGRPEGAPWPPPPMKERMMQLQREDGIPIYIKGGFMDKALFQFTFAASIIGTVSGLYTLIRMAVSKK